MLMRSRTRGIFLTSLLLSIPLLGFGESAYLEPGALRLSHELSLEGVFHQLQPGWSVQDDGTNKIYSHSGNETKPWESEWGARLLTDASIRVTPDIFARVLIDAQGDYADRFWRPNNIENYSDQKDHVFIFRQAEANVDKENYFLHAFSGIGHGGWQDKGDFFELYPTSRPDDDYMGLSSVYGIYPERWKQDAFLNISKRHVPRGFGAGANMKGYDAEVAYGEELQLGYSNSGYGRFSAPIKNTTLTFVYKDEDVPYSFDDKERNRAYALSWDVPSEEGHRFDVGVMYNPFRVGKTYVTAHDASSTGGGIQGSNVAIGQETSGKSDAFAERLRVERHVPWLERVWVGTLDLTHAEVLAGNKNQLDFQLGTDVISTLHATVKYTYRTPLEGPVPFLFEGTPDNVGNVVASPRGPESPFTVNWQNREAVFLVTTLTFDPTPGSPMFQYDPTALSMWNLNPNETSPYTVSFQHRMADYKTSTDRQYYYNSEGNIVWEPAGHSGAWASEHPLQEFRLLGQGRSRNYGWSLGLAGGQSPALSGLAYSLDPSKNKPLSEYYSVEGKLERGPLSVWGHYGTGLWGPEPFQYFFGESFDRVWGLGAGYKLTLNTTIDVSYLSVRQDDSLFVAPDLGSYNEIRMLFSHRFGFLFQFQGAARPGYRAP